jgi:hypothetical protein
MDVGLLKFFHGHAEILEVKVLLHDVLNIFIRVTTSGHQHLF